MRIPRLLAVSFSPFFEENAPTQAIVRAVHSQPGSEAPVAARRTSQVGLLDKSFIVSLPFFGNVHSVRFPFACTYTVNGLQQLRQGQAKILPTLEEDRW